LSLAVKLNAISHIETGEQNLDVIDLTGSTVQSVIENKIKIKECGKIASPLKASKLNGPLHCSNH
jgi:hypothetical protein